MPAEVPAAALSGKAVPADVALGPLVHEGQQAATSLPQSQSINGRPGDQAQVPGDHCQGLICPMRHCADEQRSRLWVLACSTQVMAQTLLIDS